MGVNGALGERLGGGVVWEDRQKDEEEEVEEAEGGNHMQQHGHNRTRLQAYVKVYNTLMRGIPLWS